MSTIDAALIKEQGVTFAVVTVQRGVINNPQRRDAARRSFGSVFGQVPIVLMEQDGGGRPTYHGRRDLVNFLSKCLLEQLPWKRYTVN